MALSFSQNSMERNSLPQTWGRVRERVDEQNTKSILLHKIETIKRRDKNSIPRARRLRRTMMPDEKRLWNRLRNNQLLGLKVRRQHPIGPFITDFFIAQINLAIELDGYSHEFRVADDHARDRYFEQHGIHVLRIMSSDILCDIENVLWGLECIYREKMKH